MGVWQAEQLDHPRLNAGMSSDCRAAEAFCGKKGSPFYRRLLMEAELGSEAHGGH
jgi:hypothetical protein